MNRSTLFGFLLLLLVSCNEQIKVHERIHTINVVAAQGYVVPHDSVLQAKAIRAGIPLTVPAGVPAVIPTNTNVHLAGTPRIVLAGTPRICTPGQDTFPLPKIVPATSSIFLAGIPKVTIAKDAASKDRNPQNFSFYNKLQGLRHGVVRCMLEDQSGNLWLGTNGGGVSKYDGKSFTHFTEEEGLSNNIVLSMIQDRSGNFWFGTDQGGVSKYDGKSFTHFTEKEGLSKNVVWSILEDKAGNIWFGTGGGGVSKYDGVSFTHFTDQQGLGNNYVLSILEDKSGNMWFGTSGRGVSRYDGRSFSNFTDTEGLSDNFVLEIVEDRHGNLWFGTQEGVSKYDGKSFTHLTVKEGLSNNAVHSILEDQSGNLWFGTFGGGMSRYGGKYFTTFSDIEGLNNNFIRSILEDRSGNLWCGTNGGGVSKYDGKFFTHFTDKEGLSNSHVLGIFEDRSKNIWLSTYGGGISRYDGVSFTHYTDKEGLSSNTVFCGMEDRSGNLWFGTNGGGVSKFDGKSFTYFTIGNGLSGDIILSMLEDKFGNLWFGTYNGGVVKFDGEFYTTFTTNEGLGSNTVRSILEDKSGNLWFCNSGEGVSKFDGKSFTHFTEKDGLSTNEVLTAFEDNLGNIWFGTDGGGICKYDGKFFTHITEKEGLSNNVVLSIIEDKYGNMWFGTRVGISKLSKNKALEMAAKIKRNDVKDGDVFFKNYTYEDGFLGIGCYGNSICLAADGTIWIGANDRLTAYHPPLVDLADTVPPQIQILNIALFNENVAWANLESRKDTTIKLGNGVGISNIEFDGLSKWYGLPEKLSLPYNNNYLSFNFIGVTMLQPKMVKYQYKLEGIDDNWSAISSRTEAPYGNLPHGNYTFKVRAMNSEGYWSKELNYSFVIRPPWWKTLWFRLAMVLLVVGSIWYYIKNRERKLISEKDKLERTVEERTEELIQKNIVVEQQKFLVEEKHKEITDSINYAERIQKSFLASKEVLDENLGEYFVFFKPKDVVSGDFYWATKIVTSSGRERFALVTADSTGHGVPGAIMSLLNITSLEKAIESVSEPSDILNATRKIIIDRLKKDGSVDGGKDGMDAVLTVYDFLTRKLTIAAANNPVWIVRSSEIIEIKPDKWPVGKHDKDNIGFTQQEIDLQKGDVVYTLTDGMPDQFGGPKGKKFMHKQLKDLLVSISHESMEKQRERLETVLNSWKGDLGQVDDITIIGVRV